MKQQVRRLSPHQNGKVVGVLTAIGSLVFVVPLFGFATVFAPKPAGPPVLFILLFPFVYLVAGYLGVALGCALYNLLFPVIGGIEFEAGDAGG